MEKERKDEDLFIPKTKHKGLKIMLAIILIALLGVGGYFLYQEKFNNPKATVMNIINDAEKDAGSETLKLGDLIKANLTSEVIIAGVKGLASAMKSVASGLVNLGKEAIKNYADY